MKTVNWTEWVSGISHGIKSVDDCQLTKAAEVITSAGIALVAGNGGSAALASHFAQAIAKPAHAAGGGRAAVCLTDNIATLSAHANDGNWQNALVETARPFIDMYTRNVVVVCISSSGKSENIVHLAQFARARNCDVLALTGFDGGPLRSLATWSLHVESRDYEVIEPVHDALLHRIQYYLRLRQD